MLKSFDWKSVVPKPVIGVDEVGRGCLAGRVYAGAVHLKSDKDIKEFTDSKLLSEKRREELAESILKTHQVSIAFATVDEIDKMNILQASLLAMKRAVRGLELNHGHILVDGHQILPSLPDYVQTPLIKGDLRAAPISAASIVAKVARDRYMKGLANEFPIYGFEKHKGYATKVHQSAIQTYGPCVEHRKTFAGVKEWLSRSSL